MNPSALILGATGRPLIKVGDQCWRQFSADPTYNVSIEWYVDGRECEPLMAIWSKHGGRDAGVFGICLSSIGKYADPDGTPSIAGVRECLRALPTLGRAQLDIEVRKLVDVVMRHTPDLINCPPAPPAVRRAEVGEPLLEMTTKTQDGKTIDEAVI